ncbi:MAG TPA: hypothetical protein VIY52_31805 [Streptosporangiaceae bacterium]
MRAVQKPPEWRVRRDIFPARHNREDPVGTKTPEGERQRNQRRRVHPLKIVDNYRYDLAVILDEPKKFDQCRPAGQRIRPTCHNCRICHVGAHGKGTEQCPGHPQVHPRLGLGASTQDLHEPGVLRQEPMYKGALADASWTAQIDNARFTMEGKVSLSGEGGQLVYAVDET